MNQDELRLSDVEIFLHLLRLGSVNGTARGLRVSPAHVSKSVARLERCLGLRLMTRSARGVTLSDDGRELAPRFAELIAQVRALTSPSDRSELTLSAPAFLSAVLVPAFVADLDRLRVHCLETPPGVPSAFATAPLFDVALTSGEERWPDSWVRTKAGAIRRALYARPGKAKALGRVTVEKLREQLFIGPLYSDRGQLVLGDDKCPLNARDRRFGHRTQTVALALDLALRSDQLVFAPTISARPHVVAGALVEIPVPGWNVREPVYLVCHQDRVEAQVQRKLLAVAQTELRA
jgi:DNA-binding transcriptional LysR family regulator